MDRAPVIVTEHVSKCFQLHYNRTGSLKERFLGLFHNRHRTETQDFWALKDVNLTIRPGEAVALVGRNGSGKSTLLKLIAGVHRPTEGRVLVRRDARIGSLIQLGVGFNADLTGRENVYMNASIYGLSREAVDAIYDDVVKYAEIGPFLEEPIKNYSSGMVVRLAFAVAAHLDPDILLLDEIFAVGDADFQEKCQVTMQEFLARGKTMIFVSHTPSAVRKMCRRVCVLSHGQLVFDGGVDDGLDTYERVMQAEHQVA
jgi:ABC-2 type transport system ATP-binding protein